MFDFMRSLVCHITCSQQLEDKRGRNILIMMDIRIYDPTCLGTTLWSVDLLQNIYIINDLYKFVNF